MIPVVITDNKNDTTAEEDLQVSIVAVAGSNLQVVPAVGEPEGSEGDSGQLALRCHHPLGTYHSCRNR